MILTRVLAIFSRAGSVAECDRVVARKLFLGFIVSGMILTTLSGVFQLFYRGIGFYMSQGWFHTKLTLVLILFGVTLVTFFLVQKYQRGEALSLSKINMLHGLTGLALVAIVFLTMLGR